MLRKGMALQHPEGASGASGAAEHPGAAMAIAPRRAQPFGRTETATQPNAGRRPAGR